MHRSSPYQYGVDSLVQLAFLSSISSASLGNRRPFLGGRPFCPGRRSGAGSNRLASSRNLVTKQTWWRTAAIRSSAEKLAMRGAHRVAIDAARSDLAAPTAFDCVVDSDHHRPGRQEPVEDH